MLYCILFHMLFTHFHYGHIKNILLFMYFNELVYYPSLICSVIAMSISASHALDATATGKNYSI